QRTESEGILSEMVWNQEERIIQLDEGLLDPVYRYSATSDVKDPWSVVPSPYYPNYSGGIVYAVTYLFVGFDGLVRIVLVHAQTEDLLEQATNIVECTYTFDCLPSSQTTVNISRLEQQVLFDSSGVRVTLFGYYEAKDRFAIVSLLFENDGENDIIILGTELRVNQVPLQSDRFLKPRFIPAGDGVLWRFDIGFDLTAANIDSVSVIGFSFQVLESDGYMYGELLFPIDTDDLLLTD
ncbi:MAG: hypothetical protein FWD45_01210, partial [Coriobacteriia bacterium]|nr:hypothetical protein [Coriobacteriia bacterium]